MLEYILYIWVFLTTAYFFICGKRGFTFFKSNLPWVKNHGAWYIKGLESGRVDIDFTIYTDEIKWPSKGKENRDMKTIIDQPYSHTPEGKPILFVKQGVVPNFDPFKEIPPSRAAAWFGQLLIRSHNAGRIEQAASYNNENKMQGFTLILLCLTFIGVAYIAYNMMGMNDFVVQLKAFFEANKPALEAALKGAGVNKLV